MAESIDVDTTLRAKSNDVPFTITALSPGSTVYMLAIGDAPALRLRYTTDGVTFFPFVVGETVVTLVNAGDWVSITAVDGHTQDGTATSIDDYNCFRISGSVNLSGLVDSLLYSDASPAGTVIGEYAYAKLFSGCPAVVDAGSLHLASMTQPYCYFSMFEECYNLRIGPTIKFQVRPAGPEVSEYCCNRMFSGCSNLVMPASIGCSSGSFGCDNVSLRAHCFDSMYENCYSLGNPGGFDFTVREFGDGCCMRMYANTGLTTPAVFTYSSDATLSAQCFSHMYEGCGLLTSAPELPAIVLAEGCYSYMFRGCVELHTGPLDLPASQLASSCYEGMFEGSGLGTPPIINASVMAPHCCAYMFKNSPLIYPPTLDATLLAYGCYMGMFEGSSISEPPELPATSLESACYADMFRDCSLLTVAPTLPATSLASSCYSDMFRNCSSLTVAPALPATELAYGCYMRMFEGSSISEPPELPATLLAPECYASMFRDCLSLTVAPTLPASRLEDGCYAHMFEGCSSLTFVAAGFTAWDSPEGEYDYATPTFGWLYGVHPSGEFHFCGELPDVRDGSHIPDDWVSSPDFCQIAYAAGSAEYSACIRRCSCCDPALKQACDDAGGTWNPVDCTCSCACGDESIIEACFNSGGIWNGNTCQCMCAEPTHQSGCHCECCDGGDLRSKCLEIGGKFDLYKCQCYGYAVS